MAPKPLLRVDSVLDLVGHTPLVRLKKTVPGSPHKFFAKVEYFNPGMSVKDRMAKALVEAAEKRGELKHGGTIVEATSGNTGVGLAMVAAVKGYNCIFTIPSKMSQEKINSLRAYGAKVIVTPAGVEPEDPQSHYSVARRIAKETPNAFLANQYDNPDNPEVHYRTTGPEIWEQTEGKLDLFVAGIGTGGTLSGTAKYLKEMNPKVRAVCADPVGSILHDLFYFKEVKTAPTPYELEGIGEDMLPKNVHFNFIDDFVRVEDKPSFLMCRRLLKEEGLFVGPSSAAALVAAIQYTQKLTSPMTVVVLFPDSASKYMSKVHNDEWMRSKGFID